MQTKRPPIRVLLVDDDEDDFLLIRGLLSDAPSLKFELEWVDEYDTALQSLGHSAAFDVCLLDYRLGERSGLDLLKEALSGGCMTPMILLTGHGDYALDLESMRVGAADYLTKNRISTEILERSIRYAIRNAQAEAALEKAKDNLEVRVRERTEELVKANRAFRRSEAQYRAIVEDQTELISRFRPDGTLTFVNGAYCCYFDEPAEKLIGSHFWHHVPEEDRKMLEAHIQSLAPENPVRTIEHRVLTGAGEVRWQQWTDRLIVSEGGIEIQAVGRDITERRQAEDALRAATAEVEQRARELDATINSIADAVMVFDRRKRLVRINQQAARLLDYTSDGLKLSLEERVKPLNIQTIDGDPVPFDEIPIIRALRGETVLSQPLVLYPKGKRKVMSVSAAPIRSLENKLLGTIATFTDLTQQWGLTEELRRAHDELEQRVAERTVELALAIDQLQAEIKERRKAEAALLKSSEQFRLFAHGVIHDLKSPAIGIHGLARLLLKQCADSLDDKAREYCEQILKASEWNSALVEKINIYMESKETPLRMETFLFEDLLQTLRVEFEPRMVERGIRWILPEDRVELCADRLALLRVFRNLIDNALKYGGKALSTIRITHEATEGFHRFSVIDDGGGIGPGDSERIFKPFERVGAARDIRGAGLGLNIVKEIVERHGGMIMARSGSGKGAAFIVTLPVKQTRKELALDYKTA